MIARIALGFILVLVAACGGGASNPMHTDGNGRSDGADPKPVDAAPDIGYYDFGCGPNPACHLNEFCCVTPGATTTFTCEASCPMADQLDCNGPTECGGTTPVCCGVEVPNGTGKFPSCGLTSLGTSCTTAAACATNLGQTCSETSKVQLCHVSADCTDATNNDCCTFASGAATLTFCIDSFTAGLAGATCH